MKYTLDIRKDFCKLLLNNIFIENNTIEIINASFISNEAYIFGKPNEAYLKCELEWYMSQSRRVSDMPGDIPLIWKQIASNGGYINSNYGWCIFNDENYNQFDNAIKTLINDKTSRQSSMIYIRPQMHKDAFNDGMRDFICTYAIQLLIRDNKLHYIVYMRSNDAVFGYKNDRYWHNIVFEMAFKKLKLKYKTLSRGHLYWNAASLHIYARHYYLVYNYINK